MLELFLDFGDISSIGDIDKIEEEIHKATADLSAAAHAHLTEYAMGRLHSLQEKFIKNLPPPEKIEENTWLIRIPGKDDSMYEDISWIEEGIPNGFDLLPGLLSSPKAKEGKNGKYLIVPFKHNEKPSNQSTMQKALAKSIMDEMNKRGISRKKIELNPDGSPKLGLLHKFDIQGPKQKHQVRPPSQGPQGQNYQTKSRPSGQEGAGGRPYVWGTRIYQKRNSKGGVDRNIFTFRTASASQSGQKWIHQGLRGIKSIEETYNWAENEFESKILVEILRKYNL